MHRLPADDLWRNRDFVRFWTGESVSLVGSQITALALPFMAVLVLSATAVQMGLLGALGFLPFLLVTLPAGAWIDRLRRRPILIVANLGRAALLAMIPLAALFGFLRIELLYLIAFASGVLTVAFEVAYLAYVPSLVPRARLTTANGRLLASASAAEMGGPGLAGLLISLIGAPMALAVDAASYVVSAASLVGISRKEAQPPPDKLGRRDMVAEIREGLRITFGSPLLRAVASEAATYNGLYQMIEVLILLYLSRELGLDPATIGLLFTIGALGSLLGSLAAGRLAVRFGVGRMNASYRAVVWGVIPIGALVGGLLGQLIGLRATLAIAAIGLLLAPLWVLLSPIPQMRRLPLRSIDALADAPA